MSMVPQEQAPSLKYAISAALGMIADHFGSLVGVVPVVVGFVWMLDMTGGISRSVLLAGRRGGKRAAFRAFSTRKAFKGIAKLAALVLAALVAGFLEIVQKDVTPDGVFIPLFMPVMFVALVKLALSVVDQINDLWEEFGQGAGKIIERATGVLAGGDEEEKIEEKE